MKLSICSFIYLRIALLYYFPILYIGKYTPQWRVAKIALVAFGKWITERGLHIVYSIALLIYLSVVNVLFRNDQKWAGSRVKGQARIGNYV